MDLKQIAKDSAKTLVSYLTYQAVRVVIQQLSETNPPMAYWLSNFSTTGKIQDGEAYIQEMMQQDQGLALRIMTVRSHLAQEVTDFLPEMVRAEVEQANANHRRQYLERVTQLDLSDPTATSDPVSTSEVGGEPPLDADQSTDQD
jgi:RbcX protein